MKSESDDLVDLHAASFGLDIVGYADGAVDVDEQNRVEAHLVECEACASAVDDLRATLLLLELARMDEQLEA